MKRTETQAWKVVSDIYEQINAELFFYATVRKFFGPAGSNVRMLS
jgi:hypothetical protein